MISPIISVLIPVYNVENYVEKCLHSIFSQRFADKMEYIIVDDCSSDNSLMIVHKVVAMYPLLKSQISVIRHEENKGIAATRNTLLQSAQGRYIQFLDSDDWCAHDFFEKIYEEIIYNEPDIIGFNYCVWDGYKITQSFDCFSTNNLVCIRDLLKENHGAVLWGKTIRRNLISQYSLFFKDNVDLGEDTLFSIKLFCWAKKIIILKDSLYYHRINNTSSITKKREDSVLEQLLEVYFYASEFLKTNFAYSFLKEDLVCMKIRLKLEIINKARNRFKYYGLWPEMSRCVFKVKDVNMSNKFLIFFSTKNKYIAEFLYLGRSSFSYIKNIFKQRSLR